VLECLTHFVILGNVAHMQCAREICECVCQLGMRQQGQVVVLCIFVLGLGVREQLFSIDTSMELLACDMCIMPRGTMGEGPSRSASGNCFG
jgi:hypothetical protein